MRGIIIYSHSYDRDGEAYIIKFANDNIPDILGFMPEIFRVSFTKDDTHFKGRKFIWKGVL